MSDLATRLREHVNNAAPPIDVDALIRQLEQEPLITAVPPTPRRYPDWALAVVVAVVVLVVVGGAALLFSGGASVEPADTIPPVSTLPPPVVESGPVFRLGVNDLCSWFTAQDMNGIVTTAQQRVGTSLEFVPFVRSSSVDHSTCSTYWGTSFSSAWASPGSPTADGSIVVGIGFGVGLTETPEIESRSDDFVGHYLLGEGVQYLPHAHGASSFALRIDGHEDSLSDTLFFNFGVNGWPDPEYEELGLAIANELLRGMNWIDD